MNFRTRPKYIVYAITLLAIITINELSVNAQKSKEKRTIKETALNYAEGCYGGDTLKMKEVLAPGMKESSLMIHPNAQGTEIKVKIIELGNKIASVKMSSPEFVHYLLMGKMNGDWKIYYDMREPNSKQTSTGYVYSFIMMVPSFILLITSLASSE